jgi:tetratricopeptide (TPR) repeat protein
MQLGDYAASLVHLTHLPRELQERAQALAVRCADHAGLQNRTQAEATEKQLLASPDLVEADVITILPTLARQHQAALAIGILEGWDKRGVASADALHPLAALYAEGGSLDKARATLERVAQLQGVSVSLLMELARVANAAVHFFFGIVAGETDLGEEAYRSLEKAVSLDANNPYYNYALGATMMNREDVHDAYPYFQKYCALKPQDPRGRLALAAAYFYGPDLDLAQKELHSVAGYKETATGAHYFLGRVANQEGRYAEAVAELQKALEGNPRYADAYAELGIVYLKQKQDPEAEKCLAQALEISPDNIPANFNLMILYQRRGDPRAEARAKRFEELRKLRWERQKEFLRTIQVQP